MKFLRWCSHKLDVFIKNATDAMDRGRLHDEDDDS
jgi:hypothetical protein